MTALNIKNEESVRLVKERAELEVASMTTVVIEAVREKLAQERAQRANKGLAEKLLKLGRNTTPLWKEPWKSTPHGELLYDEKGLPRQPA